ncbi:MAG: serine dehydratase beta chain, partial [Bacteroidota bacterium]
MSRPFISVFDMFKIGVGPSSSHTLGPWRAAGGFVERIRVQGSLNRVANVKVHLFGSLAKTGKGHGTDMAVLMGLTGADPVTCDTGALGSFVAAVNNSKRLQLGGEVQLPFDPETDLIFHRDQSLPFHPNGMRFNATFSDGGLLEETAYSIGGGFIVRENEPASTHAAVTVPYDIQHADDLLQYCNLSRKGIADIVLENECCLRSRAEVEAGLLRIWSVMRDSVYTGCHSEGMLPGGLNVARRAAKMSARMLGGKKFPSAQQWLDAIK